MHRPSRFSPLFAALLTLAPGAALCLCSGRVVFTSAIVAATPDGPRRQCVADFNGDGTLDRAIAFFGRGSWRPPSGVQVEIGLGDGTFRRPQIYVTGNDAAAVATADFDGDGVLDLVVANNGSGNVSLLLGQGCDGVALGTFGPPRDFPAGVGPHGLVVADFDSDNHTDVAVANNAHKTVTVLLGDGRGFLGAPTSYAVADLAVGIAVGDFNHDGIRDLVTTCYLAHTIAVLLGHGDGTFAYADTYPAGVQPYDIALGDFDEDGITDLAVGNAGGGGLAILRGTGRRGVGDGGFHPPHMYALDRNIASVTTLDANQDGILDLAFAYSNPPKVGLLIGLGRKGRGNGQFVPGPTYSVGANPAGLLVADFNQDGTNDLCGIAHDASQSWMLFGHCERDVRRGLDLTR